MIGMEESRYILGRRAEEAAAHRLEELGYVILDRNFRTRRGEIDIIARDGPVMVFVEVKGRSGSTFGGAAGAVGGLKRRRIIGAARAYLAARRLDSPVRFDVIIWEKGRWEHFPGAFQEGW